ncbi:MAG: excinuclease ABC subunit A, partial [Bdellovibrionaceae bacterium]|nr:excinuclease ABC subunit A [Pseudobdellovibrionaceae bacterium]
MTIDPVLNHVSQSTINNQDGVPTIPKKIILKGVRQNNLQNLSLELPLNQMIVICGPSGSGKSSLAFETLHTEAQRRFIESLSHYAKQFIQKLPKPNLESACNLPPSIALEQKNGIRTSRSSVGTITEIQDYLRLLFDKLALPYCPLHNKPCQALDVSQASKKLIDEASLKRGYLLLPINWTRQMGLKWQGHLIQHGFYRILSIDKDSIKIININESPLPKSSSQEKKWYVILDRLEINVTDFQRICDSLENGVRLRTHLEKDWFGKNIFFFDGKDFWLRINLELQCPDCDFQPPNLSTGLFNFNSPSGACPHCKGFGNILEFDINKIIPNPNLSIQQGAIEPFTMPSAAREKRTLLKFCQKQKIPVEVPWNQLNQEHQDLIWNGDNHFKGIQGFFNKLENKKYKMHVRVFISRYRSARTCPECGGLRLRKEAYVYRVHGQGWDFFLNQQLSKLKNWFEGQSWSQYEWQMGHEIISQILARLNYLVRVGVGYLTLNRATRTLSGGEYQRIMLANQLGNELSQALYVLDEPTIGLHPQDNDQLISIIQDIKKMGNTVVLVEHDEKVIQSAEYIIEMGPGSGINGGQVMFQGRYSDFIENPHSVTAQFLRTSSSLQPPRREVSLPDYKYKLELKGACGHNLKNI